jgi:UDP-2,4-diacetamido-2,4,6-trideoxy-beta-L-altropyranose hydrolase
MQVAIRTDASLAIGTGHVMRCLTLAERLRAGGAGVLFLCRDLPGHQCAAIAARGFAVRRLPAPAAADAPADAPADGEPPHAHWLGVSWQRDAQESAAALPWRADWLVLDHYGLDARWQRALRPAVSRILVIDDLADRPHDCDLLLDQNLSLAGPERYDGLLPAGAQRLLGPQFALLRDEFAAARATLGAPRTGSVRRLLVFIGGADQHNETGKVLHALQALQQQGALPPGLHADVIAGGANPHYAALQARCAGLPYVTLHRQVGNMAALLAAADLAVGAGGGAMWERACLGLPALVIAVAGNQQGGSAAMAERGCALYLGPSAAVGPDLLHSALRTAFAAPGLLRHLGRQALALVDGRGAERAARAMARLGGPAIALRPAQPADCDDLWSWRNSEAVRRFSGDGQPIALESHRRWFAATLAHPARQLLVGEIAGRACGILRYDREQANATISIYLTPEFMGQGIGAALIAAGSAWVARHWPEVAVIEAAVKPENGASAAAFLAAGYAPQMNIYVQRLKD